MTSHGIHRIYAIVLAVLIPLYAAIPSLGQAVTAAAGTAPLLHLLVASNSWLQNKLRRRRPGRHEEGSA